MNEDEKKEKESHCVRASAQPFFSNGSGNGIFYDSGFYKENNEFFFLLFTTVMCAHVTM